VGFFAHGNESFDSIIFPDYLRNHKKDFAVSSE
jgi:hypothetical protein